ncbi:MAG TPA: TlpA disulfide reductase family protein [Thiobacillaceae bacterium]
MWLAALVLALAAAWAQAADFRLTDTQGKTHTLAGYQGKWVLVNYWATWCPPCLEEIPDLIALHENKQNNLVVIGVALDYRTAKQGTDFAAGLLVDYPIVLGNPDIVRQIGPVRGLPTTYLFNPEGKMVAQQVGAITREMVERYIASKAASTQTNK